MLPSHSSTARTSRRMRSASSAYHSPSGGSVRRSAPEVGGAIVGTKRSMSHVNHSCEVATLASPPRGIARVRTARRKSMCPVESHPMRVVATTSTAKLEKEAQKW